MNVARLLLEAGRQHANFQHLADWKVQMEVDAAIWQVVENQWIVAAAGKLAILASLNHEHERQSTA